MRIFVTVGTDHHPFARLADWLGEATSGVMADLRVQAGLSTRFSWLVPADGCVSAFLTPEEMYESLGWADVVVCHGGPATISEAWRAGHKPIVVPRDPALGEHVDGHQVRYSAALESRGLVVVARSRNHLRDLIGAPTRTDTSGWDDAGPSGSLRAVEAFERIAGQVLSEGRRRTDRRRNGE